MTQLVDHVLVIGAGLIGGSLAKALRQRQLVREVTGYGRRRESLLQGVELGVLDNVADDLPAAIAAADLIVLGVPTLTVEEYLPLIARHRKSSAIVTDVASVKGEIARVVTQVFGEVPSWFVLAHPIAGSEQSGIAASNGDLYVNHKVILTPLENTDHQALQLVSAIWSAVGANVDLMTIELHDRVFAATSHLPHVLAFSLVDALATLDVDVNVFDFAAGGFRDFTRIASSHPVMWHDIMLANKDAILDVMAHFKNTLEQLESAIKNEDGATILAMFERAKAARDKYSALMLSRQQED